MDDDKPAWSYSGTGGVNETTNQAQSAESVTWTASEFIAHDKDAMWYVWLFGASAVLSGLLFVISGDVVTSLVILLISVMLAVVGSRKPSAVQYELSAAGLNAGGQRYAFGEFRSFSIVEEGAINSIWLKPLARFKPMVVLYFAPEDENKIINTLSLYLPHEQRELDAVERASRRLRF